MHSHFRIRLWQIVAAALLTPIGGSHGALAATTKDRAGTVMIELGAGAAAFVMEPSTGPTYAGTGPSFGLQLSLSLDSDATHRLFLGVRYTGLDAIDSVLKEGRAPGPEASDNLDAIAKVPVMVGVGYSVGIADTGLRAGIMGGYASVEHDGGYVHGWIAGITIQVPILTFRLGR